jgi:nitroreductase
MEFREVVHSRHSVREFSPAPVDRERIERILLAANSAPSSQNEQPWRFYVATGDMRIRLGGVIAQTTIHLTEFMDVLGQQGMDDAARWYSELGKAPVLIGVGSPSSEDQLARLNRHLSVGAALENLLLAAVDEGLAACNITFSHWVEDEIADLLGLPEHWDVLTVVALGEPGESHIAPPKHRVDNTVWLD